MIRILFFFLVVLLLGVGFAWLADRPGDLVVTFAGMQYKVTLMVAASAIVAIVAAVMLTWWIVKSLVTSPYALRRHFRARKRDRGYQSLSTGLIAAGAGDGRDRTPNDQAGGKAVECRSGTSDQAARCAGGHAGRPRRGCAGQVRGNARRSRNEAPWAARSLPGSAAPWRARCFAPLRRGSRRC